MGYTVYTVYRMTPGAHEKEKYSLIFLHGLLMTHNAKAH